jgi:hypothetical protein
MLDLRNVTRALKVLGYLVIQNWKGRGRKRSMSILVHFIVYLEKMIKPATKFNQDGLLLPGTEN